LDVLREGVRLLAEALMELEVSEQVGAGRYERTPERKTYRNGYRERVWETRVGQIPLRIPKLRQGSYFPSLLEPRRRAERALVSVVQEAYVAGVSTRKVDDLVRALGLEGCSRSEVSRICRELDEAMERFRSRPLEGEYPYVWLDAKAVRVRYDGRVVHMAAVVAIGVRQDGSREVLGFNVGASETYEFWAEFLRQLVGRGLRGVRLVISDAHEGLRRAISEILAGASWQRSRVHFMRNVLQKLPRHAQGEFTPQLGRNHSWTRGNGSRAVPEALEQLRGPLLTTWPAFTEAMYLLGEAGGWRAQKRCGVWCSVETWWWTCHATWAAWRS
jgi:putative transposase